MRQRSFLENASLSTILLIVTKLIGILPVFFLKDVLGEEGFYAYGFAMTFAVVALDLANAGIPIGIARYVAKSNERGDYETSYRIFKFGSLTIFVFSLFVGLLMFLCAPMLASGATQQSRDVVIFAIRMFVPTIIVVPLFGVIRGYFQGHKDSIPGSMSQLIDNFVWFIALFTLIFAAGIIFSNNIYYKTGFAMGASFFGAVAGGVFLWYCYRIYQPSWKKQIDNQLVHRDISVSQLLVTLVITSLPLTLSVFIMNSYAIVSDFTYVQFLHNKYSISAIQSTYAILTNISPKIASLPLVVANTLALASIPFIVTLFHRGDKKDLSIQVKQSILITFVIMSISAVLTYAIGPIIYQTLFLMPGKVVDGQYIPLDINIHQLNAQVLAFDGIRAFSLGMATIMITILQSMNKAWKAISIVAIGGGVKLVATIIFLLIFGPVGDVGGSIAAYFTVCYLTFRELQKYVIFSRYFYRCTAIILLTNIGVVITLVILVNLTGFQITATRNFVSILLGIIEVTALGIIGGGIYLIILQRLGILRYVFSKRRV